MNLIEHYFSLLSHPPLPPLPPSLHSPPLPPQGANTHLRCRWTDMNALHYAAFFDIPEIVNILVKENPGKLSLSQRKLAM